MSYNGQSNACNWKGYKTHFRRSGHKCAFSPTATAPMLTSWFYLCSPLFLIPFSTTGTKAYLCSPLFLIPFSTDDLWYSAASGLRGNLVIVLIAEVFNLPSFGLKCSVICWALWKRTVITLLPSVWLGCALLRVDFPYFYIVARRDTFHALFCLLRLCKGVSIHKYKAYWHINFLLINGCGTHKNKWCLWVHQYYNCYQKGKQTSVIKDF